MKQSLKNSMSGLRAQARRHPLTAGIAAAVVFTLILNMNVLVAAMSLPLLLSTLPCLLMMAFCMKGMKGSKDCDTKSTARPAEKEVAAIAQPMQTGREKFDA